MYIHLCVKMYAHLDILIYGHTYIGTEVRKYIYIDIYIYIKISTGMSLGNTDNVVDTDGPPPAGLGKGGTVTQVPPGSFGLYLCLGPSVHPVEEAAAGMHILFSSDIMIESS
jgi:hypothetical protein